MARATSLIFTILICICVTVNGSVIKADENHEFPAENWWDHATLYQVYPKSFKDTDGNGVGDLKGIESELQYLKDIGVDAFWMNPMFASPQKDDGYDISDYRMVNPDYGTMEDFKELVKKAKELDIRVLLDLVPNHSSDEHEWFEKSVKKDGVYTDYYIWHDGKVDENGDRHPPNNWVNQFCCFVFLLNIVCLPTILNDFFFEDVCFRWTSMDITRRTRSILLSSIFC